MSPCLGAAPPLAGLSSPRAGNEPVQINFPVPHPPVGVEQMGQGGGSYQGRDCSPLTAHGFHGIEAEVVQGIVAWIKGVSAKRSRPPK